MSSDPMLAKIRKLLAKAEDPATTAEESELYTAKAGELISAYGIDQALLALEEPSRDQVGERIVFLEPPYAVDKAELASSVAQGLRCQAVLRTRQTMQGKQVSVHLFGYESDLVRAELLFTSLLLQATSRLSRAPVPRHQHKAAFRRSWLAGFRLAVARRLLEAERRAEESATRAFTRSGTTAAVVLADRSASVSAAVTAAYPRVGTSRPRQLSGDGMAHGWAEGQRADLGEAHLTECRAASLERRT